MLFSVAVAVIGGCDCGEIVDHSTAEQVLGWPCPRRIALGLGSCCLVVQPYELGLDSAHFPISAAATGYLPFQWQGEDEISIFGIRSGDQGG